jgi:hypothetical protein
MRPTTINHAKRQDNNAKHELGRECNFTYSKWRFRLLTGGVFRKGLSSVDNIFSLICHVLHHSGLGYRGRTALKAPSDRV